MLCTGVDLIEIARIQHAVERHGQRFLQRVYTSVELDYCHGRIESLAARFAAKEAVAKALGTGIWRNGIGWTDIEIASNRETGAPLLTLYQAAHLRANHLTITEWSISLSHDREKAIAFVVGLRMN